MAHDACSQVIEPGDDRQQEDACKQYDFIRDGRQGGMNGFLKPGCVFVVHNALKSVLEWETYTSISSFWQVAALGYGWMPTCERSTRRVRRQELSGRDGRCRRRMQAARRGRSADGNQ